MRIETGTSAPNFVAKTVDGKAIDLSAYQGRPVWLAFFRYASCPLCNLRVHQVAGAGARFQRKNLKMIAVFQSKKEKLEDFVAKQPSPFAVVTDPKMDLFRLFGVEKGVRGLSAPITIAKKMNEVRKAKMPMVRPPEGPALRIPADFLIDQKGTIRVAHYGADISDSISFEEVDAFLDSV